MDPLTLEKAYCKQFFTATVDHAPITAAVERQRFPAANVACKGKRGIAKYGVEDGFTLP
jgi:hypothetical protein